MACGVRQKANGERRKAIGDRLMQNAIINTRRKVHTMEQPRRGELFIELSIIISLFFAKITKI
jgi:hypothetical protein